MATPDPESVFRDLATARATMSDLLRQADFGAWVNEGTGRRVGDVAAHVAQWDAYAAKGLEAFAEGGEFLLPAPFEIHAVNQRIFEEHRARSREELLEFLRASRERLLAAAGRIPPARWSGPVTYPWGAKGGVAELLLDMAGHDRHHAAQVRKAAGLP